MLAAGMVDAVPDPQRVLQQVRVVPALMPGCACFLCSWHGAGAFGPGEAAWLHV